MLCCIIKVEYNCFNFAKLLFISHVPAWGMGCACLNLISLSMTFYETDLIYKNLPMTKLYNITIYLRQRNVYLILYVYASMCKDDMSQKCRIYCRQFRKQICLNMKQLVTNDVNCINKTKLNSVTKNGVHLAMVLYLWQHVKCELLQKPNYYNSISNSQKLIILIIVKTECAILIRLLCTLVLQIASHHIWKQPIILLCQYCCCNHSILDRGCPLQKSIPQLSSTFQ